MSRYYQSVMGTPQPLYVGAPLEMDLLKQKKVDAASQEIGSELAYIPEQFKKANALSEMLVYDKTIPVDDKAKISAKLNDINGRMKEIGDQVQQGNINPMEIVGKIRGLRQETDQYFASTGEGGKYQQMYDVYQKQQKVLTEDKDIQNNQYLGNSVYGNRMAYRQGQSLLSEQPIAKYVDQIKEVNEALTGIKMQVFSGSGSARDNAGYINKWIKGGTYDAKILGSLFGSNWQAVMQGDLSKIGGALANSSTIKQLEQKQIMMQRQGYKPEEIYGAIMKEVRGLGDYAKEKFRENYLESDIKTDEGYWKQQQWGREDKEKEDARRMDYIRGDAQQNQFLQEQGVLDKASYDKNGNLTMPLNPVLMNDADYANAIVNDPLGNMGHNSFAGNGKGGSSSLIRYTRIGKDDKGVWHDYKTGKTGNTAADVIGDMKKEDMGTFKGGNTTNQKAKEFIDTFRKNNSEISKNMKDSDIGNIYNKTMKDNTDLAFKWWIPSPAAIKSLEETYIDNDLFGKSTMTVLYGKNRITGNVETVAKQLGYTLEDFRKLYQGEDATTKKRNMNFVGHQLVDINNETFNGNRKEGSNLVFNLKDGKHQYDIFVDPQEGMKSISTPFSTHQHDILKTATTMQPTMSKVSDTGSIINISVYNPDKQSNDVFSFKTWEKKTSDGGKIRGHYVQGNAVPDNVSLDMTDSDYMKYLQQSGVLRNADLFDSRIFEEETKKSLEKNSFVGGNQVYNIKYTDQIPDNTTKH